jgi:hypothetical protein
MASSNGLGYSAMAGFNKTLKNDKLIFTLRGPSFPGKSITFCILFFQVVQPHPPMMTSSNGLGYSAMAGLPAGLNGPNVIVVDASTLKTREEERKELEGIKKKKNKKAKKKDEEVNHLNHIV